MNDQTPGSSGRKPEEPQHEGTPAGGANPAGVPPAADQPGPQEPSQAQAGEQPGLGQPPAGDSGAGQHAAGDPAARSPYQPTNPYQQPHYPEQAQYAEQGQYAGQPQHPEQVQYQGQPQHPGQVPHPGQAQHPEQAGQQTQQFAQPGGQWAPGYQQGYQQYPGMAPVQAAERTSRKPRGIAVGLIAASLVAALVGGGVGGYVGYQFGGSGDSSVTSLDQQRPARSASTAPQGSVQAVADKVLPSVVQLQVSSMQGSGEGSGIVLSEDGYILTNNHVVEAGANGQTTALFHDNRTAPVRIVGTDPNSDLAVVKADITGLQPAELGRSDDLPVGAPVVAIGSPFGLSGTVTSGIISAKDRPVRAGGERGAESSVLNALQTDAAINPGNSGGPLVDMDGRVVGINSAIYSPGSSQQQAGSVGLGFAIPIDQAKRIAEELKNTGKASQTTLGVRITTGQAPGALVVDVTPGGAAEQAGIRGGDLITKINDRAIQDPDALIAAVRSHAPGEKVTVTVSGPGGERTTEVTLSGQ
ncbi:trypsin-like peptidase domain-containing protein [Saccharopolyspora sp. CA-218241]|uniref:S1C family serine protease n=1 Tax=Saccharopolyspora sp. CA-218241 TaxID=3240027 RepID=UPI003D999E4F